MSAQITIPLDLPDVRVLKTEVDPSGRYWITVESALEGTKCRRCGRAIEESHGHDDWIELQHLPILDHPVTVRLRPRRYRCRSCPGGPTTTQRLSWYSLKSPLTGPFERYLLLRLVNATVEDLSLKEGVSYDRLLGMIDRHLDRQVDWSEWEQLEVLGIDEIALKKGQRDYVAIVSSRSTTTALGVLAVLPDRTRETLQRFLQTIPPALQATVKTVCIDMWDGYCQAARAVLPAALIVVDRFHVARGYRDGADTLRKQEMKRLKTHLPEVQFKEIQRTLWPFRKKSGDLQEDEAERLNRLFEYSPALKQAYDLREALTGLFEQPLSKNQAKDRLKEWEEQVRRSGLSCFDRFLTTLENWKEEITNYFLDRQTSGFVEGLNNKVKVLKRRCYGLFNVVHLFQRLSLDLDGYRRFASAYP